MSYSYEDTCNGCEECRHCGRDLKTNKAFYCDSCGESFDSDELRQYEGEDICKECFLGMMEEEWDGLPCVKED